MRVKCKVEDWKSGFNNKDLNDIVKFVGDDGKVVNDGFDDVSVMIGGMMDDDCWEFVIDNISMIWASLEVGVVFSSKEGLINYIIEWFDREWGEEFVCENGIMKVVYNN